MSSISLSNALVGYGLHMESVMSPHTISDYRRTLRRFADWWNSNGRSPDPDLDQITPETVRRFLGHWSQVEVRPGGCVPGREPQRLSAKTIRNMHTALSAFFSWCVQERYLPADRHPIRGRVPAPPVHRPQIQPLSVDEINALRDAARHSAAYTTSRGRRASAEISTGLRNRALLEFLLHTGARASECELLRVRDLDLKARTALVHGKGRGRERKPRTVPYGAKCGQILFRYLADRGAVNQPDAPVFATRSGGSMTRNAIGLVVKRMGKRAGVPRVHPHLLRHTFAVRYVVEGGDVASLQRILGHTDPQMSLHYANLADEHVQLVGRRVNPMDRI